MTTSHFGPVTSLRLAVSCLRPRKDRLRLPGGRAPGPKVTASRLGRQGQDRPLCEPPGLLSLASAALTPVGRPPTYLANPRKTRCPLPGQRLLGQGTPASRRLLGRSSRKCLPAHRGHPLPVPHLTGQFLSAVTTQHPIPSATRVIFTMRVVTEFLSNVTDVALVGLLHAPFH